MAKREFASLIIKLLGIYTTIQAFLLLEALIGAVSMISFVNKESIWSLSWILAGMTVPFLLCAIAAAFLFIRADYISRLLIKNDDDIGLSGQLSGAEFQAICFATVGVLVFLLGIPRLFQLVINFWYSSEMYGGDPARNRYIDRIWQTGIPTLAQFVLAVILFFRAKGLANFWHRIQAKFEVHQPKD